MIEDSEWCDAVGTIGTGECVASIRLHCCSHIHLSTSSARFVHTYFPSFAEQLRADTTLARYTDLAWMVWSVCTADPDTAPIVLLEHVLSTATIDVGVNQSFV